MELPDQSQLLEPIVGVSPSTTPPSKRRQPLGLWRTYDTVLSEMKQERVELPTYRVMSSLELDCDYHPSRLSPRFRERILKSVEEPQKKHPLTARKTVPSLKLDLLERETKESVPISTLPWNPYEMDPLYRNYGKSSPRSCSDTDSQWSNVFLSSARKNLSSPSRWSPIKQRRICPRLSPLSYMDHPDTEKPLT